MAELDEAKAQEGLMAFMVGFGIGAKGGFLSASRASHPDIAAGFNEGAKAADAAYRAACERYQSNLSILRSC